MNIEPFQGYITFKVLNSLKPENTNSPETHFV